MKRTVRCLALLTVTLLLFPSASARKIPRDLNQSTNSAEAATSSDAYVGQYFTEGGSSPGVITTITKVGDKLFAERNSESGELTKFELFPQSRGVYILKSGNNVRLSITFVGDINRRVPQFIIANEDDPKVGKVVANRISSPSPYTPSPQKLSEYVGPYKMEGMNLITKFIIKDGELFVVQVYGREVSFFPDSEDRFLSKEGRGTITFMRDDKGGITHLISETEGGRKNIARKQQTGAQDSPESVLTLTVKRLDLGDCLPLPARKGYLVIDDRNSLSALFAEARPEKCADFKMPEVDFDKSTLLGLRLVSDCQDEFEPRLVRDEASKEYRVTGEYSACAGMQTDYRWQILPKLPQGFKVSVIINGYNFETERRER